MLRTFKEKKSQTENQIIIKFALWFSWHLFLR